MRKLAILIPLLFAPLAACDMLRPWDDPNPVVAVEFQERAADFRATQEALAEARDAYEAEPTPETEAALRAAEARHAASEQALDSWLEGYYREKHGGLVGGLAGAVGAINPALQPVALGAGALALNIGAAFFSRRGRKHLANSIRRVNPLAEVDGKRAVQLGQAAVDVARALGWVHSTPASKAAAEGCAGDVS